MSQSAAEDKMGVRAILFHCAAPYVFALIGLIASIIAYFPGIMEPDSVDQFTQARTGQLDDWHPPMMALLWRALNHLYLGPQFLFLLHLALFWLALALIGDALMRLGARWAALTPLIGLTPWFFPIIGVILVDVSMTSAWLFAGALLLHQLARGKALKPVLLAILGVLFVYGALARANTIFAAAPLIYYACAELAPKRVVLKFVATALTPFVIFAAANALNHATTSPTYPLGSLQIFDLGGISHNVGANVMPGQWTAQQASTVVNCYQPDEWDHYGLPECGLAAKTLNEQNLWNAHGLTGPWLSAIAHHPVAYAAHRLAHANQFFRWWGDMGPGDVRYDSEDSLPPGFAHHPNALYNFYLAVNDNDYPALRPYFWLLACAGAWLLSVLAVPSVAQRFATALSASGSIYLATFFVVGVASEFRYALWSICAASVALCALLACQWQGRRLAIAGGACVVLALVVIIASMISASGA